MKRFAVIGCGLRSDCYLHELAPGLEKEWQLAALADPSDIALEVYLRNYGNPNVKTFRSGPELLKEMKGNIDAVIIASPNSLHLESLLPAMDQGLIILLEKPVATTVEDCAAMWKAYVRRGCPPLAVGFVLRYTTFYQKVKELIDSGAVGQVLSIEATEMMGTPLSAMYYRGWRRKNDISGPLILEKCSHDMDLLNWFGGTAPTKVSSFATRTRFTPNPDAAMHCKDCGLQDTCRYSSSRIAPYLMNTARRDEIGPLIPQHDDLCVFNSDKDIIDHQVVNIEYGNGVLVSFTVCADQPRTTRTIKVNGTQGQIIGDIGRDELRIDYHLKEGSEDCITERFTLEHDDSGHHGGDSVISNQYKSMLRGKPTPPLAGLREGIEACLVAIASEQSACEGKVVDMNELYKTVFS